MIDVTEINVLIVEDDALIANDISSLLKSKGYQVVPIAHNYDRALNILKRFPVDFALLDISMEDHFTGITIARKINEDYKIPFVFLTSFSDKDTQDAAQDQSPYGYLVKPYQEATLLSTIALAITNSKKGKEKIDFNKVVKVLTKSEHKVCELLCTSLTYVEISERLFVSINTVRFHAKNIYFKLDIGGRSELLNMLLS